MKSKCALQQRFNAVAVKVFGIQTGYLYIINLKLNVMINIFLTMFHKLIETHITHNINSLEG